MRWILVWPRQAGKNKIAQEIMDMRKEGEAFCADCPDHEGCMQGYPCSLVKRINNEVSETE